MASDDTTFDGLSHQVVTRCLRWVRYTYLMSSDDL